MSERLLPYRGIEPPEFPNEPWENALFEAQTQAEVDHARLMKQNAMTAAVEFGDEEGHPFHGNQYTGGFGKGEDKDSSGLGGKTVEQFVAEHPRLPGEDVFVWQGRIVQGLPKETQSDLIFKTRERYEPVGFVRDGISQWNSDHNLPPLRDGIIDTPADLHEAEESARYFEQTPDQSDDPRVQAAYADFREQSDEMYGFMTKPESEGGMGIKVDFTTKVDPYDTAEAQAADLRDNHHITLQSGLGGAHEATMEQDEYDRFRAVHDVFGHAGIGGGFDRHGEYEAWLTHASMYTGDGRDAMSTEYHGVNSAMWSGDPGTPGTGKSILLPDSLSDPPWERSVIASAKLSQIDHLIDALGLDAEWATKFSKAPWHTRGDKVTASAQLAMEFGDTEGHPFHGNQWTGGIGDGSKENPIHVSSAIDAAYLIGQGKYVQLPPEKVSILLDKLAKMANEAKLSGTTAPNYDLCKISVPDSNLFCAESKDIPRIDMPQLATANPVPGSPADALPRNDRGWVDISGAFLDHLRSEGHDVSDVTVRADQLKATQNELNGSKVAGLMEAMESGKNIPGSVWASNDNYVLDGHHRWAAEVGLDYSDNNKPGDITMPITRVDMPISVLLDSAKQFAADMGVPQAAVASARLDITLFA